MNEKSKLISTIVLIFTTLLFFNLYLIKPLPKYKFLKVENASEFYVDLNKNKKIDNDELIKLYDINSFNERINKETFIQSKKYGLKINEILALGVLAKEYSQKNFLGKEVQIEILETEKIKNKKYSITKIYYNKKDIGKILLNEGLSTPKQREKEYIKELNFINLEKNLEKIKQENIVILDEQNNKIHKLTCPHTKNLKNIKAIKLSNVYLNAQYCNTCFKNKKSSLKTQLPIKQEKDFQIRDFDFTSGSLSFFFTDFNKRLTPDKNCKSSSCIALLEEINNAKSTIDIAIYGIAQQPQIINALIAAKNRGVKIRWVTDADIKGNNIYKEVTIVQKLLTDFKTDNHIYPPTGEKNPKYTNAIMHNKFFIFDDNTVWLGSSNLSQTDLADFNANINLLAKSKQLAHIYKQEFEQMYNEKFHELKSQIPNKEKLKIDEKNNVSVYFSPPDKIITKQIIPAINNAQNYVYISSFIITHKQLENALISAKLRGLDVRIITDATSANGKYSIHNSLRQNNIPVKIENKAGKMHSKSIVIDDELIFVGSMNLTRNGENKNDENILLIKNHNAATIFKEQFLYLFNSIPNIYLTKTPRAEGWDSIGSCNDGIDNDFDDLTDKDDNGCK